MAPRHIRNAVAAVAHDQFGLVGEKAQVRNCLSLVVQNVHLFVETAKLCVMTNQHQRGR